MSKIMPTVMPAAQNTRNEAPFGAIKLEVKTSLKDPGSGYFGIGLLQVSDRVSELPYGDGAFAAHLLLNNENTPAALELHGGRTGDAGDTAAIAEFLRNTADAATTIAKLAPNSTAEEHEHLGTALADARVGTALVSLRKGDTISYYRFEANTVPDAVRQIAFEGQRLLEKIPIGMTLP